MMECMECSKEYDLEETKRIHGDVWWVTSCCSSACYTAMAMKKKEEKDYYYLEGWSYVGSVLVGPFSTVEERDETLTKRMLEEVVNRHSYFPFSVTKGAKVEF